MHSRGKLLCKLALVTGRGIPTDDIMHDDQLETTLNKVHVMEQMQCLPHSPALSGGMIEETPESPLTEEQIRVADELGLIIDAPNEQFASDSEEGTDCSVVDPNYVPEIDNVRSPTPSGSDVLNKSMTKPKTKKRMKAENEWKRNIKKQKVNSGQEYLSRLGKVHRAKQMKPPPCGECKYKCIDKIPDTIRAEIFNKFYAMADKTRQRDYILRCTLTVNTPLSDIQNTRRQSNKGYYFEVEGERIRVCKKFFMATLDVSNNTISTALKKQHDGFLEKDMRGAGPSCNRTSVDLIKGVQDHINSFARVESHYCRAGTTREYLDGTLNLKMMYDLYKDKCVAEESPHVTHAIYSTIFNTKFNISFFKPKKDLCAFCVSYENGTPNEKIEKKEEYDKHIKNFKLSRMEKENDKNYTKNRDDTILAIFDLQAVMPVPNGNISTLFYKSKLNIYNFTIYDAVTRKGFCYLWHEGIAKRGAIEISTCIYQFLKDHCQGKREVIFFSDNCVAQNKNKYLYSMYIHALKTLDIQLITHKYLIVGHTENEGDSMHSCIEREKNRILKGGPIFVPTEIAMIIKCAKKNEPRYELKEMETSEFIDWKQVCEKTGKNFTTNNERNKCIWNTVKMIQIAKDEPYQIKYKETYTEDFHTFIDVRERMRVLRENVITLESAYTEPPSIPANKKRDLISLCQSGVIPNKHHNFFENLKS